MKIATINLKGELENEYEVDIAEIGGKDPLKSIWLAYQKKHPAKTYVDVTRVMSSNPYKTETWRIYQGKPMQDIPTKWKVECSFIAPELSSNYNSGSVTVYRTGGYQKYSTYRDGCFWEYVGVISKIK